MTGQELTLLDAIRIGMEAEQEAAAVYADAAEKAGASLGREIFQRLAEFEQYHYRKLAALEQSLREERGFIEYEPREFQPPAVSEVKEFEEPDRMSMLEIISKAMTFERKAEKRYIDLAKRVSDQTGKGMFERLAEEERLHFRILENAYWSLNNHGVWAWSAPAE